MRSRNVFKCPENEHGFVSYSTRSGNEMKPKTLKDL